MEHRFKPSEDMFDIQFFAGLNWVALEDGSLQAPYYSVCDKEAKAILQEQPIKAGFDAPPYVGDSRWCDDWEYTCTVGASVETSTTVPEAAPLNSARRASTAADALLPRKSSSLKQTTPAVAGG